MSTDQQNDERIVEIDVVSLSERFRSKRWMIFAVTVVAAVVAVAYTFFQAPVYEARTSIILPMLESRGANVLGLSTSGSSLDMYAAMMQSDTAIEMVTEGTELSRRRLMKSRDIEIDGAAKVIYIRMRDEDRDFAIEIAERTVTSLRTLDDELRVSKKSDAVASIAESLLEKQNELAFTELALRDFREEAFADGDVSSVFKLDLRAKEATLESLETAVDELKSKLSDVSGDLSSLSLSTEPAKTLRAQLVQTQIGLFTKQALLSNEHPDVVALLAQLDELERQISDEVQSYLSAVEWGLVGESDPEGLATLETKRIMAKAEVDALRQVVERIPDESLQLRTLTTTADRLGSIVKELESQHAMAKIELANDPQTWSLLDTPHASEIPINKNFPRSGFLGAFLGFVLGLFISLRRK